VLELVSEPDESEAEELEPDDAGAFGAALLFATKLPDFFGASLVVAAGAGAAVSAF